MAKHKIAPQLTEQEIEIEKTKYTRKIESPIYEPRKNAPIVPELYDTKKRDELIKEINKEEGITPKLKEFLISAAERHTVFDFGKIADYYAHMPVKYKYLFENSALVIIDYDNAVRNGFVSFQKEVDKSRLEYLESLTSEDLIRNKDETSIKKQKRLEEELSVLKSKESCDTTLESWIDED